MSPLRELFLLDPTVIFLNHGSFGATPRPVFEAYQAWQRQLERQPVNFIQEELGDYLAAARAAVGAYVGAAAEDVVFVRNATTGVNIVAHSLPLAPGDEILASDHEYGACVNAWHYVCRQTGAVYRPQTLTLPADSADSLLEQFWQGVTPHTKVIFLSHITSPTALRLPVEAICARARDAGILTLIDGAHTIGQIDLNLTTLGADFYASNLHKWALAPKGSAFLYTRPSRQALIEPLIVGWGWGPHASLDFGSPYLNYLQWLGTEDPAAYLAAPAALDFLAAHNWPQVRADCHELVTTWLRGMADLTGLPLIYGDDNLYGQMAAAPLPPIADLPAFKAALYRRFRIEMPCTTWQDFQFARISVQGYNDSADVEASLQALATLLAEHAA